TLLICISGGILGVIFTVPLRNVMVVKSDLPYPEGVAAAEILKAGDESDNKDSGIKEIVSGSLLAASVSFLTNGLRVVADGASYWFK
ncbi:oligopeptide transporter, OPT family, partial [Xanthomonas citri pv. citri]|nr:oligopeptide transporter, OPT family [Xanthomonas citri pv. citri]